MTSPRAVVVAAPAGLPLEAFSGPITPGRTRPLYKAGLAVVAFAMVLLPLLYIGLIGLAVLAVMAHLRYDTWMLNDALGRNVLYSVGLYLGPVAAGAILVFFMVKPFFAARSLPPEPITLDRQQEPLLFAFVDKVCAVVGARAPCRIDVDCQVNASASLRRGLLSRDLVLTIGLPLAAGLDMRQLAGVLAHEFGHFAQGAGMRLTYIIRKVNFWFARVVYERDAWDLKLDQSAKRSDLRLAIVLHAARGCVWVTRRILWVLMQAGHAISCFMLRQMEFDADSYGAKLAGSATVEATALRLRILNAATQIAYNDVRQSWASNRLPENLPLLIDHKATSLPPEMRQQLSAHPEQSKTRWFDTHPCDGDRVRETRRLREPGVFHLTEPGTALFTNFDELSKRVTKYQYEKIFKLVFTEQNLMSAAEILAESAASAEADLRVRQYFGSVNLSLKPWLEADALPLIQDRDDGLAKWHAMRQRTEELRAEAERVSAECLEFQQRLTRLWSGHYLARANFKFEPKAFGLSGNATSPHEQEVATQGALEETAAAMASRLAHLEPFLSALRARATLALALAPEEFTESNLDGHGAANDWLPLLAAVSRELSVLSEIGTKLQAFILLIQNRSNHAQPARVDQVASELVLETRNLTAGIQERLHGFVYPFPHPRSRLTVAEYARTELASENEWQRTYNDGSSHVDRLFALHYRLVGKILARLAAAERKLSSGRTD